MTFNRLAPASARAYVRFQIGLLLPILLLQLSYCNPAFAQAIYLPTNSIDGIRLLPPPPLPDSPEEAADLAAVRAVVSQRTPDAAAHAAKSATLNMFLFQPAIGPWFKPGALPKVEQLFDRVKKDMGWTIDVPKNHWNRLRPYQHDPALLLGKPEPSTSYPSGHSTRGIVYSLLFAELFPEKRDEILAIGREIGWHRIVIGKHYMTDVYAGRTLGQAVFHQLMASEQFQRDLAEAKAEIQSFTVRAEAVAQ
jgi:acid phosphatase (class A)